MSICASGSSVPKAGVPTSVVVDTAYMKSLLPANFEWLADFSPYMKSITIGDIPTFCSLDPPTFGLPSSDEMFSFVTGGYLNASNVVTLFIGNVFRAYLWWRLCECSSGATPAPPAAIAKPANLPAINPVGIVSGPAGVACAQWVGTGAVWAAGSNSYIVVPPPYRVRVNELQPIPTGVTSVTHSMTAAAGGTGNPYWENQVSFYGAGGYSSYLSTSTLRVYAGNTGTRTQVVPSGAVFCDALVNKGADAGAAQTNVVSWDIRLFCGAAAGQVQSPCCPPDPIATGLLERALGLLELIQRQVAPFAYIASTQHSGLTGEGSFYVQGLMGLQIQLTTLPAYQGRIEGTPDYLYDVGYVAVGTDDGYQDTQRVDQVSLLWFPPQMGAMTLVGYSLRPNIVARITELKREP